VRKACSAKKHFCGPDSYLDDLLVTFGSSQTCEAIITPLKNKQPVNNNSLSVPDSYREAGRHCANEHTML